MLPSRRGLLHDRVDEDPHRDVAVRVERDFELGGDEVAHDIVAHVLDEHEHDGLVHHRRKRVGGVDEGVQQLEKTRQGVDLCRALDVARAALEHGDGLPAVLALHLNLIRERAPQRREQRQARLAQIRGALRAPQRLQEHHPGRVLGGERVARRGAASEQRRHEHVERVDVRLRIRARVGAVAQVLQQERLEVLRGTAAEALDELSHRRRLRRALGKLRVRPALVVGVEGERKLRARALLGLRLVVGGEPVGGVRGGDARGVRGSLGVADADVRGPVALGGGGQDAHEVRGGPARRGEPLLRLAEHREVLQAPPERAQVLHRREVHAPVLRGEARAQDVEDRGRRAQRHRLRGRARLAGEHRGEGPNLGAHRVEPVERGVAASAGRLRRVIRAAHPVLKRRGLPREKHLALTPLQPERLLDGPPEQLQRRLGR